MNWLMKRLSEPSTHAAFAGILAALIPVIPPQYQPIASTVAVLFGGAGVLKGQNVPTVSQVQDATAKEESKQ